MTQEDIIEMRDKNCPDYLCGRNRDDLYYAKKIEKLEAAIKKLKNTSSEGKKMEDKKYVRCQFCDSAVTVDQIRFKGGGDKIAWYRCPVCGLDTFSLVFL